MTPTTITAIEDINRLLPQWQCQRCEYPSCRAYAQAISEGAPINRCPPGGTAVLAQLRAWVMAHQQRSADSLEDQRTINPHLRPLKALHTAIIRTEHCIGCARCIPACPLGAIIGGKKAQHIVLESLCSGCELCVPVCPMDCIDFLPAPQWTADDPRQWVFFNQRSRLEKFLARQQKRSSFATQSIASQKINPNHRQPSPAGLANKQQWLKQQMQSAIKRAQSAIPLKD